MLSALALFRAPNQQPFGDFERHWLDRITPHIQRASRLHLRLESLRAQAHDGWQAANMLDYPVLVVNDAGQVRFANLAAEALLRLPRAPLRVAQGQLRGTTPAAQEKLVTAVRHATAPDHRRGNVLAVQREFGAPAYQLVVLPAADHCELALPSDRPLALIVIGAPGQGRSVDAELLRQLFSLSDAEARVVVGLTQGSTPGLYT